MSNTPYDDVFRTLLNDCSELILPVLNEIFGTDYCGDEKIEFSANELFVNLPDADQRKLITDTSFVVYCGAERQRYHLECESRLDTSIFLRIIEYDMQIALEDRSAESANIRIEFPNTAVIALRCSESFPDEMTIEIVKSSESMRFTIPILKAQRYSLEMILEKKLLFLLPFYIFSLEKQFHDFESNRREMQDLIDRFQKMKEHLEKCTENSIIDTYTFQTLTFLIHKVAEAITAKYERIQKEVQAVMGGTILDHPAKTILNKGRAEGRAEGETRVCRLILRLSEDGRTELLERISTDHELLEVLYKEYNL